MRLAVGSDERTHLTDAVVGELQRLGHQVKLLGALGEGDPLWPIVARAVAEEVVSGRCDEGVLLCWTGTGVTIAANKVPGIRAALCDDAETAAGARTWNLANVLTMSLRRTSEAVAKEILQAWFATPLGAGEDADAVAKVADIERTYTATKEPTARSRALR
ncbi:MAG: RpiB/LacA/LacB family sugar-phosphate isomerase [Chloroflexi bacterium]|nr:RpiB/LacA/LacB family sugar-phosphate isomerase [Chloroflexota bacterium]